jgi:hypothetical protein
LLNNKQLTVHFLVHWIDPHPLLVEVPKLAFDSFFHECDPATKVNAYINKNKAYHVGSLIRHLFNSANKFSKRQRAILYNVNSWIWWTVAAWFPIWLVIRFITLKDQSSTILCHTRTCLNGSISHCSFLTQRNLKLKVLKIEIVKIFTKKIWSQNVKYSVYTKFFLLTISK